jgi:cell division protein ZapE
MINSSRYSFNVSVRDQVFRSDVLPSRSMPVNTSAPEARVVQLSDRDQAVEPSMLLVSFLPQPRFETVRFSNYSPNPGFASQSQVRDRLERLAFDPMARKGLSWFGRKPEPGIGVYLDGGFGVGKTHLLAATWHAFSGQKFLLSFSELTFTIGALGMDHALKAFSSAQLLCIDEFELDDIGNTLVVSRFLAELMPRGTRVVATSNTLPEQLGEGRFNADDFKREIQGIANRFEALRLDGPDYRHREGLSAPQLCSAARLEASFAAFAGVKAIEEFAALQAHLARLHPIRFAGLLEGIQAIFVRNLEPIRSQDDALRFVHFVDKLYDRELRFAASGCDLEQLFLGTYRYGGYAKKYARCLSRLGELLREGETL